MSTKSDFLQAMSILSSSCVPLRVVSDDEGSKMCTHNEVRHYRLPLILPPSAKIRGCNSVFSLKYALQRMCEFTLIHHVVEHCSPMWSLTLPYAHVAGIVVRVEEAEIRLCFTECYAESMALQECMFSNLND